jgi:hypothetical protein
MLRKTLSFFFLFTFLMNSSFAGEGIKSALQDYQYAMTVEWDQQDPEYAKAQEEKLLNSVESLLQNGHTPKSIVQESLALIPDAQQRNEIQTALNQFNQGELSKAELLNMLANHSSQMSQTGASWSVVGTVILGLVLGYASLKILFLVVYYWDTDWDYGETTETKPDTGP